MKVKISTLSIIVSEAIRYQAKVAYNAQIKIIHPRGIDSDVFVSSFFICNQIDAFLESIYEK